MPLQVRRILPWLAAVAAVWLCLAHSSYVPNDGDGWLYTQIATEIAKRGWAELLVVKWYGQCHIYAAGSLRCQYFYEHPPGLFVLPLILAEVGLPAAKATLFADTVYQLATVLALFLLFKEVVPRARAATFVLAMLFLPISCVQTLRATQETPMLMLLCLTLLCLRKNPAASARSLILLFVLGAVAALIKGLMLAPLLPLAGFAAQYAPGGDGRRRWLEALLAVTAMLAGAYVALTSFEKAHLALSGHSFWLNYLDIQLWHRSIEPISAVGLAERTLAHFCFYLACTLWYALPWTLSLVWHLAKGRGFPRQETRDLARVAVFGVLTYILPLSCFARESMRYILPAYYLAAIAAVLTVGREGLWCRLGVLEERYDTMHLAALFWGLSRCGVVLLG